MYAVLILEEAREDLRKIARNIASENPSAAEALGGELLDEAMSLESLPYRGSRRGVGSTVQGLKQSACFDIPKDGTKNRIAKPRYLSPLRLDESVKASLLIV
jgi:hypothetical protein